MIYPLHNMPAPAAIQQIETNVFTTNAPLASATPSTATASTRASMRRMRTETATPPKHTTDLTLEEMRLVLFEKLHQLEAAFKGQRYEEALEIIDWLETLWNETAADLYIEWIRSTFIQSPQLEPVVKNLSNGIIGQIRSYFLAMTKNPEALALCESSYDQLLSGFKELPEIAKEAGESADFEEEIAYLEHLHLFFRGLIELNFDQRENAIRDIRKAAVGLSENSDFFDLETIFYCKIVEKKLDASLLPLSLKDFPESTNEALFLQGRYEEAIQNLSSDLDPEKFDMEEELKLKGACLAMLGKYDEALECLQNDDSQVRSLIYFLQGNLEAAKSELWENFDANIGIALLLTMRAFE